MAVDYQVTQVVGNGANIADAVGPNPGRHQVIVRNLGPAAVWLGDRDTLTAQAEGSAAALGARLLPGEDRTFRTPSPIYAVTWPNNSYTLEIHDE